MVVEKEEEVKGRMGVEDAYIRMRMSAQIEMSRLTSAFAPPRALDDIPEKERYGEPPKL